MCAGEAEDYKAILAVCDAADPGMSSNTMAIMDEMSRLGTMWEEAWHATLADLQVPLFLTGLAAGPPAMPSANLSHQSSGLWPLAHVAVGNTHAPRSTVIDTALTSASSAL